MCIVNSNKILSILLILATLRKKRDTAPVAQKLFILCGNAAYNRGDRANLTAQIALLKSQFPGTEISVGSYRADVDRNWYDAKVIDRGRFFSWAMLREIRTCDAVIWGGGALIADNGGRLLIPYWLGVITFVRCVLRKPVMMWAHGIVTETQLGRMFARILLRFPDMVTVRDLESLETAKALGCSRCILTADPAILLRPESVERGKEILREQGIPEDDRPLFAIAPTFWHLYHQNGDLLPYQWAKSLGFRKSRAAQGIERTIDALTKLADVMIEQHGCRILLLPRYPSDPWNEERILEKIKARSRSPENMFVYHGDAYAPREYFSLWHSFDCLISVALHDAIVATALGVPCAHIFYEPKGKSFFERIGSKDRLLSFERFLKQGGPLEVAAIVDRILQNWPTLKPSIERSAEGLQEAARANALHLDRMLTRKWTSPEAKKTAPLQPSIAAG